MCDPSILEDGQRCATGAPICDRHRDELTGPMRPKTAAERDNAAVTARLEAVTAALERLVKVAENARNDVLAEYAGQRIPAYLREVVRVGSAVEDARNILATGQPAPVAETWAETRAVWCLACKVAHALGECAPPLSDQSAPVEGS